MSEERLRPATADDAAALTAIVEEGFAGYRAFGPPGWEPPPGDADRTRAVLVREGTWCLVAEDEDGAIVGHVAFFPATEAQVAPSREADLAHLWQVFVRPPHWGTGLAPALMRRAVAEARERGFARMRLFTPAGQERARRFYEREGFATAGEPRLEPGLGLELVEYRRAL